MHDVSLAFFWHQHQPYYPRRPDRRESHALGPLARNQGLLGNGGSVGGNAGSPRHDQPGSQPAPSIAAIHRRTGVRTAISESLFSPPMTSRKTISSTSSTTSSWSYPDQMIRPYPRYHELYQKRGFGIDSALQAAKRFNRRDLLDLQCWSNLTWIHNLAFQRDPDLAEFRKERTALDPTGKGMAPCQADGTAGGGGPDASPPAANAARSN